MAYSLYSLFTGVYSYDIGQFTLSLPMAFHFSLILIVLIFFCVFWAALDVCGTFILAYLGIIFFAIHCLLK
jgi:hypothetical protein